MVSGPLTAVLAAFEAGASSLAEVGERAGLPRDVVSASVDHLVRTGRLASRELAMGCPSSGCGGCASGTLDGAPGCGASAPEPGRRGPVLVALTLVGRPSA